MAKTIIKSHLTAKYLFYYRRPVLFTTFDIFCANILLLFPPVLRYFLNFSNSFFFFFCIWFRKAFDYS